MANLFDFDSKDAVIKKNEITMNEEGFWNDQKKAQRIIRETNSYKSLKSNYNELKSSIQEVLDTLEELSSSFDEDLSKLIDEEYNTTLKKFDDYEIQVLLSHPYDQHNAILEIHPGAGGTEAMDWAAMLYRMYVRWAENKGYRITVLNYLEGEEAGLKSCSVLIEGSMAYGYLKAEGGVHRLVRISPFDSNARRHTSFASVEVIPQFEDDVDIQIDDKDLDVITMRASGAGGQHINKTDSAVRMTHIPTGIVVTCQTERSQLQNRERCINMLKSKLYQRKIEENEKKMRDIKGEQKANEWGSQIRNYVFCPYTMVKDVRTGQEEGNVDKVMDGDTDEFIFAYLRSQIS